MKRTNIPSVAARGAVTLLSVRQTGAAAAPATDLPVLDAQGAVPPKVSFAEQAARVRVVLCQTSHPGNIGAAARAIKTMGFGRLVLVRPRYFPDAQATAMASGAGDVLDNALVVEHLGQALADTHLALALTARRRELALAPLWARDAVQELAQALRGVATDAEERVHTQPAHEPPLQVALVFGNETFGLANDELALCNRWAMIPANPDYSSLNLAAAVQLLAYELRLALASPGAPPPVADAGMPANAADVEGLLAHLERAASACGFHDPAQPKRLMHRLRRLFSRAGLEREEVNILRGLLAALQKKS